MLIRKILGLYLIIFSISGMLFIAGLGWSIANISQSKTGEGTILDPIIWGNTYIFIGLLITGLIIGFFHIIISNFSRKNKS